MEPIAQTQIQAFARALLENEKSAATREKYIRAVEKLSAFLGGKGVTKAGVLEYRDFLLERLSAQTVNGYLSAVNAFLEFCGCPENRVKLLKVQRRLFLDESRELSRQEYARLLETARKREKERLYLLLLTLCGTGIRVGELRFVTVEAARRGRAEIRLKNKTRVILLQKKLRKRLLAYAHAQKIRSGPVFRTKSGQNLDRSNVCHDMKALCEEARVDRRKVFPHTLRHLFARTFYGLEKNLAYLADILGHSRLETTRIYVAVSAASHERVLERMRLVI